MLRQSAQRLLSAGLLQSAQAASQKLVLGNTGAGFAQNTSVLSNVFNSEAQIFSRSLMSSSAGAKQSISEAAKAVMPRLTMWERLCLSFSAKPVIDAQAMAAETAEGLSRMAKYGAALLAAAVVAVATPALADAPEPWQWGFQDSATSTMQAIVDLHHDITFFLITIATITMWFMYSIIYNFHYTKQQFPEKLLHNTTVEVIWTIIPVLIIVAIAIPSLTLIYSLDQHTDRPGLTVKVIGRQWYWSYEMHDHLQHKLLDPDKLVSIAEKALTN